MRTSHAAIVKQDREWQEPEHEVYFTYRGWIALQEAEPLSHLSWFRRERSESDKECIEFENRTRARNLAPVALQAKIEESRQILTMHIDPEDEESSTYSEEVWRTATRFLMSHSEALLESTGKEIDLPDILPEPDGSIDLHWRRPRYEMLINFPKVQGAPASFYGDDRGTTCIKGTLDPSALNLGLVAWFVEKG